MLNFQYFWDLNGDGIIDAKAPTNAPQSVQQKYSAPSNYNVTLSLETDKGCKNSKTKVLTIGEVPDIALQWLNACDGDQTQVKINSTFFDSKLAQVDSIVWLFGDGASFKNGSPINSSNITSHMYSQIGNFATSAKIITNLGCVNSTTVPIFKVKRDTVNKLNPYLEKFDSTFQTQGWVSGGTGSSWQWGTPTGTLISNDATIGGKAWVTNLSGSYNINEDSWVHSPCFDLTEIQRPFFKFDFRTLTREGVDGAVLQYNYQNTTDVESDWIRIDAGSSSENWYNGSGILSNPGNQSVLQRGWTGLIDSASWRTAIIPLDAVLSNIPANSRNKVRFRLAFSSSQFPTNPEGFAFDNVEIGERDRIVLLESFTNSGGSNTGSEPNKVANQAINTFLNSGTGEVIKLEYHVGFPGPGEDPLYLNNQADIGARAAYYGVAKAPTSFVNARLGNLLSTFQKETLKAARVRFDTIQMLNNPSDKLNVRVKFTAKQIIPANSTLHIAIVENLIDNPKAIGTNGETSFTHVVRKLLPDAVGTNFSMPILKDSSKTVNVSWTPIAYDFTRLEIVAFLQNTTTGEVYQTALLTNPSNVPNPSVVTGIEQLAEYIQLYPNPANDSFVIELPTKTETRLRVNLIDQVGRPVQEAVFEVGEQSKTIDTQNLAGGIYIVQIGAGKLGVVRKKMMIVHKN